MKKILLFLAISILLFNKVGYSQSPTNINVYLDDTIHFASNMHYYSVYYWDFGDGSTSTEEKPIYRFQNAGEYDVSVTAHDACCPDKDTTHYYHLTVYANQNALVDSNSISVTPNPFSDMLYVSYYIGNYNNYSSNVSIRPTTPDH